MFPNQSPIVIFDLAAQLVNVAFGPDDHPLQITLKFNPDPRITLDTRNGNRSRAARSVSALAGVVGSLW